MKPQITCTNSEKTVPSIAPCIFKWHTFMKKIAAPELIKTELSIIITIHAILPSLRNMETK